MKTKRAVCLLLSVLLLVCLLSACGVNNSGKEYQEAYSTLMHSIADHGGPSHGDDPNYPDQIDSYGCSFKRGDDEINFLTQNAVNFSFEAEYDTLEIVNCSSDPSKDIDLDNWQQDVVFYARYVFSNPNCSSFDTYSLGSFLKRGVDVRITLNADGAIGVRYEFYNYDDKYLFDESTIAIINLQELDAKTFNADSDIMISNYTNDEALWQIDRINNENMKEFAMNMLLTTLAFLNDDLNEIGLDLKSLGFEAYESVAATAYITKMS